MAIVGFIRAGPGRNAARPAPAVIRQLISRLDAAVQWQLDQQALETRVWQEVRAHAQHRDLRGAVSAALRVVEHVQEHHKRVWHRTEAISLLVTIAHLMGLPGVSPCPEEQSYFEKLLSMNALPPMRLPHFNRPYHAWCAARPWAFRTLRASEYWVKRQSRPGTVFGVRSGQLREAFQELSGMGLTAQDVRCLQLALQSETGFVLTGKNLRSGG